MRRLPMFLLLPAALLAHDMWIEPGTFSPAAGSTLMVKLRVGQELLGDPIPRVASLIKEFIVADVTGRRPVIGREGYDPAGYVRLAEGVSVLGYSSNPSPVDIDGPKFTSYLKEEGLESIIALRAKRNQSDKPVKEQFSRCAKALVLTGAPGAGPGDRVLGFPLELTAERNPYSLPASEALPVQLTWQGKPLAGALVVAYNKLHSEAKVTARTDAAGRVKLKLPADGMWMLKAVHMIPATDAGFDWSSYWASLTFAKGTK